MEQDLARTEYPSMLTHLQPGHAVQALNDRLKRINRVNLEIADWLQERRRIEEQYAMNLRRLAQAKTPSLQFELGVFHEPWNRVLESVERIAQSHHLFAESIEKDVEHPLRVFHQKGDFSSMANISNNLSAMARDLEDAQEKSDKLNKKASKASAQKMDSIASKLESATQQWESQAPFIFETLQALDESRTNQLRDLLTQYQTHEVDKAQKTQDNASEAVAVMLEISTEKEIQEFVHRNTAGKPVIAPRASLRRSSTGGAQGSSPLPPPSVPTSGSIYASPELSSTVASQALGDDAREANPAQNDMKQESKLRRLGTMFGGRRRQSVHPTFGQSSPQKGGASAFGRLTASPGSDPSPRDSSSNVRQESSRFSSFATSSNILKLSMQPKGNQDNSNETIPRLKAGSPPFLAAPITEGVDGSFGTILSDFSEIPESSTQTDDQYHTGETKTSQVFSTRAPMNDDPISQIQRQAAAEESDQHFRLSIQNKPVEEEDPEAKQAALSNVVNTLKLGTATRRSNTTRGRRDLRNTLTAIVPNESQMSRPDSAVNAALSRSAVVPTLTSEVSAAGTSDTQSVRSGHSLGSLPLAKHPEMTSLGLNASVIEIVSAVFEMGELQSTSIAGEIVLAYNSAEPTKSHETIRIRNISIPERISPNRIFVQNVPEKIDQFIVDLKQVTKPSIAFSYRLSSEEDDTTTLHQNVPLMLKSTWKTQGDKLGLLLEYQISPSTTLTPPVVLHNVVIMATYDGKGQGVQTKPSGTHLKDKHLVYWRLGDISLTTTSQKIVCRITGFDGVAPSPGRVEARWELTVTGDENIERRIAISRLGDDKGKRKPIVDDDPFADRNFSSASSQNWVDIPLVTRLVSGKYEST